MRCVEKNYCASIVDDALYLGSLLAALMLSSVIGYFLDGTIGSKTQFLSFGAFKPYLFAHPNPINVIISWIINWTISWQIIPWSSPSVSTFFPISEFSYFIIRFLNQIFLSLTFPISLSDFYFIALCIVKFDNEIGKF